MTGATKLCRGPAHAQPTRLPLDEAHWNFYRSGPRAGTALGRCKLCRHWRRLKRKEGPHGLASAAPLAPLAQELIDRCGSPAAVEARHGLSEETVRALALRRRANVRLATAQLLLLALGEQRKTDRRNGSSARFLAARKHQAWLEQRMNRLAGY